MIDAYASWPHYRDHIQPIWDSLPEDVGGTFYDPRNRPPRNTTPILVASHTDSKRCIGRPVIFIEHGVGQTYVDNRTPAGYPGGPGRGYVSLFLNPNERVDDLNRRAYPQAKHCLTGSGRVEWLRAHSLAQRRREPAHSPAVSFHWDCRVSPEARSAFEHYQTLPNHVDMSTVLGHGHPRAWGKLSRWWISVGAEPVQQFEQVMQRASAYVCDNSSTIYEAAALDIPVVLLNAPWYRKDVHHGLRFWQHLPGPMIDRPQQLARALDEASEWYADREIVSRAVYGEWEGAAKRSAAAILELL